MSFFLVLIGGVLPSWASEDHPCPSWQLPLSPIHSFQQPTAGICYAFRDVKALHLLEQQIQPPSDKLTRKSPVEAAVGRHQDQLLFRQWAFQIGQKLDYREGASAIDWGLNCEVANLYLSHGFCDDPVVTSDAFLFLYTALRELSPSLKRQTACNHRQTLETFESIQETLNEVLFSMMLEDSGLDSKQRGELQEILDEIFRQRTTSGLAQMTRALERTVKRRCSQNNRIKQASLSTVSCKDENFIGEFSREQRVHYKENAEPRIRALLEEAPLRLNGSKARSPIMLGYCSGSLNGGTPPSQKGFTQNIGSSACSSHAALITGARTHPFLNRCEVLIEDNYGAQCSVNSNGKQPWMECERDPSGNPTGRIWVSLKDLAAVTLGVARFVTNTPPASQN